jgi:hypothetical protein
MPLEGHDHNLTELAEKAKVIADATGRCEEDVLADLLDDGKANLTAGGDAKEKDFLDRATEQAEKLKTFLTAIIPILVLLGAIGAEGIGLLDLTQWGDESMFDDEPTILWGCMDDEALNHNAEVNEDDGSCEYDHEDHEGSTCGDAHPTQTHEIWAVVQAPRCEIILYDILMQYTNTSARVMYDLDCGADDDAEGFNVSVQFWNTMPNATDTLNYSIDLHYVQGDVQDIHELFLTNLTADTYDFHWIAIWEDEDGEDQNLLESWSDIEITGEDE